MRALILKDKQLQLSENHPDPKPAPGEALIRPLLMGISSIDLELIRGDREFSGVLGHEFVGAVEKISGKTNQNLLGKRVVGTTAIVCGKCDMCQWGLREHCRNKTILGALGRDGCFADRFTIPASNLIEVPDSIDNDRAVFIEPLAAAYQIIRQLTIEGRPYITVLGDGRLGLLCAQVMSQLNATVRCVGKNPAKLSLCEKWGVKHRLLDDVGLRADQDIVVDCTGACHGLEFAMKMVRPRGKIVLKSTPAPSPQDKPIDLSPLVVNEIQLIGSSAGPFSEAISALAAQKIDVLSLITRRMKLASALDAVKLSSNKDAIKILLEP